MQSKVEEKYGAQSIRRALGSGSNGADRDADGSNDSSTDSEDEDDDGILVSNELDAEIQATLNAIRSKDPRVYDGKTTFYTADDIQPQDSMIFMEPKTKPMYLRDFHRTNLLLGETGEDNSQEIPLTYAEQQNDLRQTVVKEVHAATLGKSTISDLAEEDQSDEDDFLVKKQPQPRKTLPNSDHVKHAAELDPKVAETDPEGFLTAFMSTKAWVPSAGSKFEPFESDDDDDDQRAEAFEEAYNLRFEDPQGSNEKLLSYSRDAAARYSVRKEPMNTRKRTRDVDKAQKEERKKEREVEKARLRKLKIAEAEEKIKRIKDAAGLRGDSLEAKDWSALLSEHWDNEHWEEEMRKRFGDDYYADHDVEAVETRKEGVRKLRKPKWQDEIEITDLIPNFEVDEETSKLEAAPTDEDSADGVKDHSSALLTKRGDRRSGPSSKDARKLKAISRKEVHRERRNIEKIVDGNLAVHDKLSEVVTKNTGQFRYRETSPQAYGLTPHDILMASDSQLNQFVGLKKLAAFRDAEKKKKDKKRLGKKARLRQWRKDTFGDSNGPRITIEEVDDNEAVERPRLDQAEEIDKRRRSRKRRGKGNSN